MDETFKMTIAILQTLYDVDRIKSYLNNIDGLIQVQISDISVANLKSYLMLHSIMIAQKEIYLDSVKVAKGSLDEYSISEQTLSEMGDFIDDCISNLKVSQFYIENQLNIANGILDPFRANQEEISLGIAHKEDIDPLYLNFYTSRRLSIFNSSVLKRFTDFKNDVSQASESMKQTSVIRTGSVFQSMSDWLSAMVSYYNVLRMLKQSSEYAILVYDTYSYQDKFDVRKFVNRPYADIKKDLEAII